MKSLSDIYFKGICDQDPDKNFFKYWIRFRNTQFLIRNPAEDPHNPHENFKPGSIMLKNRIRIWPKHTNTTWSNQDIQIHQSTWIRNPSEKPRSYTKIHNIRIQPKHPDPTKTSGSNQNIRIRPKQPDPSKKPGSATLPLSHATTQRKPSQST